jgi:hypothetical protein
MLPFKNPRRPTTRQINFYRNEAAVSKATPAVVQELVCAIAFKTVGGAAGKRTVLFTLSDSAGESGLSGEAIKTVNVA